MMGGANVTSGKEKRAAAWVILGKLLLALIFVIVLSIGFTIIAAVAVLVIQPELAKDFVMMTKDPLFAKAASWAQIAGFIAGVGFMVVLFERKSGWSLGWKQGFYAARFAEGFVAGLIFISMSCGLIWLMGGIHVLSLQWNSKLLEELGWSFLLFIGVAVNEELFTRGYLQGLIRSKFGSKSAVVIASIVFALLHSFNPGIWSSPLPLLNLLFAGVLLGVAREVSGGLWMPIGLHLSWNFFQGNVYGFLVSGTSTASLFQTEQRGSAVISGGTFGAEGSLITLLVLMLGVVLVFKYYKRKPTIHRGIIDATTI
jgi:membrane protease YdiL (CAAX protease family)